MFVSTVFFGEHASTRGQSTVTDQLRCLPAQPTRATSDRSHSRCPPCRRNFAEPRPLTPSPPSAAAVPGAFAFGISFDMAASTWWDKHNRGKQWAEYVPFSARARAPLVGVASTTGADHLYCISATAAFARPRSNRAG